nr:hypothetical protein SHINE37_60108 [Rhizobiaceae bacterium]
MVVGIDALTEAIRCFSPASITDNIKQRLYWD